MFFYFIDTLNHGPANGKQGLAAAGAVQALFERSDKGVASSINFILNGKDLLQLTALPGFGFANVLL